MKKIYSGRDGDTIDVDGTYRIKVVMPEGSGRRVRLHIQRLDPPIKIDKVTETTDNPNTGNN